MPKSSLTSSRPEQRPIGSPGGRVHPSVPLPRDGYWERRGSHDIYIQPVGVGYEGDPGNGEGGNGFNGSNR